MKDYFKVFAKVYIISANFTFSILCVSASWAIGRDTEEVTVLRRVVIKSGDDVLLSKSYEENPQMKLYMSDAYDLTDVYYEYVNNGVECYTVLDHMYNGLGADVKKLIDSLYVSAKDAKAYFHARETNKFTYEKESSGREVDEMKFFTDFVKTLSAPDSVLEIVFNELKPNVTRAELERKTRLIGEFSTSFKTSGASRSTNISLASKAVNGTVLDEGAIFSFNEAVGERSAKRGYKEANIIKDGVYVKGIGGGVCQVSTTLYNAVLRAGLTVTSVNAHTLAASYVPPSTDAMVSTSSDLRFINDTGGKVYIETTVKDKVLTVSVYGYMDDGVKYKVDSKILKVIKPPSPEIIYSDEMFTGDEETVVKAHYGYVSEAYLSKYKDGRLIERKRIRRDEYGTSAGVIKRGTKQRTFENDDEIGNYFDKTAKLFVYYTLMRN